MLLFLFNLISTQELRSHLLLNSSLLLFILSFSDLSFITFFSEHIPKFGLLKLFESSCFYFGEEISVILETVVESNVFFRLISFLNEFILWLVEFINFFASLTDNKIYSLVCFLLTICCKSFKLTMDTLFNCELKSFIELKSKLSSIFFLNLISGNGDVLLVIKLEKVRTGEFSLSFYNNFISSVFKISLSNSFNCLVDARLFVSDFNGSRFSFKIKL